MEIGIKCIAVLLTTGVWVRLINNIYFILICSNKIYTEDTDWDDTKGLSFLYWFLVLFFVFAMLLVIGGGSLWLSLFLWRI